MSSWKLIELSYPDGHPRKEHMSAFMPVAIDEYAPLGAVPLAEAKEIAARDFGLVGDDFMLKLAKSCSGDGRIQEVFLDEGRLLVKTSKKDIIGNAVSTSCLYMLIRHQQATKRQAWEAGGKTGDEPVTAVTELAYKGLQGFRAHTGVPVVIWDPKLFGELWSNHARMQDGLSAPVVLYLQNYRDYGTCIWPLDARWEVSPINGDRPAVNCGMTIAQQLILTLAAFTILSEITLERELPIDEGGARRQLLELAPPSYYFTRVLGSDDHSDKVTALRQTLEIVEKVEPMPMVSTGRTVRASIRLAILLELKNTFGFGDACNHARSVWRKRVAGLDKYPEFLAMFPSLTKQPAQASA